MISGGWGGVAWLASTELWDLVTKARIPGGDLQWARGVQLVTLGRGSQLRILAFGDNDLVEEWQQGTGTWREEGRLAENRESFYMGAVAVPEGLVCKAEN